MTTDPHVPDPPQFRIGSVLGRTVSVLLRNIVPFGILALLFSAPVRLVQLAVDQTFHLPFDSTNVGLYLADLLFGFLLSATLVYGTVRDLRGGRVGAMECVSRGLALLLPVVGVSLLVFITVSFFSLLLFVPGIVAMVVLWVAVPVAVVERPGVGASLSRSADLTRGCRWQIFGLIVILLIANSAINYGIIAILKLIGAAAGGFDGGSSTSGIAWVADLIAQTFISTLFAIASAVAYHDLRIAKEGASIEQIAAVFD